MSEPIRMIFPVDLVDLRESSSAGYYFAPTIGANGILQVLMHGGTYDHRYWDAPRVNGVDYSYARYMASRGYAVLAVDQIGVGASSRPGGDLSTLSACASALAQVVAQARSIFLPDGSMPSTVAMVGHSFGTITAIRTQADFHPADILVTTGLGHVPSPNPSSPFGDGVLEAELANEEVTLPPEARERAFYDLRFADPDVIAMDNADLRTILPRGLVLEAMAAIRDSEASRVGYVTGSVFIQLGEADRIGPAALAAGEAAAWTSTTDITIQTIPDIGHCFNLHKTNSLSWQGIDAYLSQ